MSNQLKISIETGGWCVARDLADDDKLGEGGEILTVSVQEARRYSQGAFQGKKSPRSAMSSQGTR